MASKGFAIKKVAHTGITVSSLSQALKFWKDLLDCPVLSQRHLEPSLTLENIVGVPDATIDNAMIQLPDGSVIELLEYSSPADRRVYKPRACDVGSVHVALNVSGAKALIEEASKLGWKAVGEPQRIRIAGQDVSVVYVFGPNGEAVELIEAMIVGGG